MTRATWNRTSAMTGCLLLLLTVITNQLSAQDRKPERATDKAPGEPATGAADKGPVDLFGLIGLNAAKTSELAQGAADLRQAAASGQQSLELIERLLPDLAPVILGTSENVARLSSEFDPFGYKTAFRTLQLQHETILRQQELIHDLQQREIERLERELDALKDQSPKQKPGPRKKKRSPAKTSAAKASPAKASD